MAHKIRHGLIVGASCVVGLYVIYYVGEQIKARNAAAADASANSLDSLGVVISGTDAASYGVTGGGGSSMSPIATDSSGVSYISPDGTVSAPDSGAGVPVSGNSGVIAGVTPTATTPANTTASAGVINGHCVAFESSACGPISINSGVSTPRISKGALS